LSGLRYVFKNEYSFRAQLLAAVVVIIVMLYFPLDTWERVILLILIAAVLVLELINSVFERMSDGLKPRLHPMVKDIKDIMAGAVLITAFAASVVAFIIFWPYLVVYFN